MARRWCRNVLPGLVGGLSIAVLGALAARGETPAAFGRRCIPAGCVAPRSNTPGILARRALPSGRIAALGATLEFHHGLLDKPCLNSFSSVDVSASMRRALC